MTNPSCDRHKNLQMIPFSLSKYPNGNISGHVCPVPTCGHRYFEGGNFEIGSKKPRQLNEGTLSSVRHEGQK